MVTEKMEYFELTEHQGHEGSLSDANKTVLGIFSTYAFTVNRVNNEPILSPYDLVINGKWNGHKMVCYGHDKSLIGEVRCITCDKVWLSNK